MWCEIASLYDSHKSTGQLAHNMAHHHAMPLLPKATAAAEEIRNADKLTPISTAVRGKHEP